MERNIKEINEVFDALDLCIEVFSEAYKDDKINFKDLPCLFTLFENFKVFVDAFKGIKDIPEEIKDLDAMESARIIQRFIAITKKIDLIKNRS